MKLGYRLSKLCGNVFENGNLVFTADGNSLISPVGNRVTIVDLVNHSSTSLPMENTKNIRRVSVSHNSRFLVSVDVDGHALFINLPKRVVLQRFHFKAKVHDIKFSPDDEYFAVTFGHGCQIWRTPFVTHEFAPLVLCRTLSGHRGDVECLDWSSDSQSIIMGSRDMSARVYYRVHSKNMAMTNLTGHRDVLRGVFFDDSGDQAFTVASDCAVFVWKFEYGDRIVETTAAEGSITRRGGAWKLEARHFLWEPHVSITSVAFNKSSNLLVVGFSGGVFGLYEMPDCRNLHKLSVSNFSLNAACINQSGEWLALGSSRLGQLLVWEWQSETYVLKQQGHLYGMNALDFSSDGHYVATGGDDGKVKLWSMSSGFCFATFADHTAPITGIKFIGKAAGKAILSCSLDGTVRAHDLLRYKNFRTLTTPAPVQFNCLAVDSSGEIVCAGALDPFNIYVWSIHTGRLLDVLAGHEGPVACLRFAEGSGVLASGSWDGTLKLWDVYSSTCSETMEHGCDVLALCFRPDGKVVCTATTNGNLTFWDVESGSQLSTIEGRRDIAGGRHSTDRVTADNSVRSKFFTTVAFSADGSCVLAGGKSKYVCIYNVASGTLVKKFQLSHNR
jgi:periodic tryptophan protein 2